MRKIKAIRLWILSLALALIVAGCGNVQNAEQAPAQSATPQAGSNANDDAGSAAANINTNAFTTEYQYAKEDVDSDWDAGNATAVVFDGDTAQVSGSGAAFSDGALAIKQAGTYVLSGTLSHGQIWIDAGKKDVVRLVLNGVTIHNETGPAIFAEQSEKLVLVLAEGTQNAISDGSSYSNTEADEPDAAIYAQDDLSIAGTGSLEVTGSYKHGIRAQDVLAITGGVIHVTAAGDALRGRDGVAIQDGSLTLEAGGDGIQSNHADDDAKGFVIVNGGAFVIQSKSDGIQAQSALTVTGGNLQITSGGGSANAPAPVPETRGGWGGRQGDAPNSEAAAADDDSISMKALKAGKQLVIAGGDIVIDAEDDAVHSNDTLFVTSGSLSIQTGDDGLHADAALEITGGKIHMPACYEGIEGLCVTISGGEIAINASDDAINAAGGADSASDADGPMGTDRFAVNGNIFVRISGGTLDLYAPHDGIDANGNIFIEGGVIKISGPSQGMEGAIDLDGSMTVAGGELITAGSVLNASQDSAQPVILVSYTEQKASGSVIEMKDASGNTLLEYTSRIAYTMSGFTSPSFTIGETYSLFIDGEKKTDIKLETVITSLSDDGSAYSGGMRRGNWGGGQMPPDGGNRPSSRN